LEKLCTDQGGARDSVEHEQLVQRAEELELALNEKDKEILKLKNANIKANQELRKMSSRQR